MNRCIKNNIAVFATMAAAILGGGSRLSASLIPVSSYDLINGNSGTYHYWDGNYNGMGNTHADNSSLTGGTGCLTDGVIPATNWNVAEADNLGDGGYVGWTLVDPTVTFHFMNSVTINDVKVSVDDSGGYGGVGLPSAVAIDGVTYPVTASSLPGYPPLTLDFSGLNLTGSSATVQFFQGNNPWVFVSEVQFSGTSVPEPTSLALLCAPAGLLLRRVRRNA